MRNTSAKQAGKTDDAVRRGRGRPRSDNPLSDAERARRYRENQRKKKLAEANNRDVTKNQSRAPQNLERLAAENAALRLSVTSLEQDLADMISAVELFIDYRRKQKALPADIFRNVCESHLNIELRRAKKTSR